MIHNDRTLPIPWDSSAWELAIKQRTDIGRIGREGDWVLYTPGRVLVDSDAASLPEVQRELDRGYATRCEEPAAVIAEGLGLRLFTVPDDRLVETISRIRAVAPGGASPDHIWLPVPNGGHGDGPPVPTSPQPDIPGADSAAGRDLRIYVLDTGIAHTVPFPVASRPGRDDEVVNTGDELDHAAGHGTHIAGIISRWAPGAEIVARRLLTTPVGMASELDTAQAIADAGEERASIINLSLGGTTLFDAPPLATERALAALPPATIAVASAGNSGEERPRWPAASKNCIAVGAVACEDGEWLRTDFSNYGYWVDCCAAGVDIPSTFLYWKADDGDPVYEGWATWTGTSFSCPQVVGAIAALATRDQISPSLAAWQLVFDPTRTRIGPVGALVRGDDLP